MNEPHDNAASKGLRGWWATPARSGPQRIISPWEYRNLRAWAGVRVATGVGLAGLGAVTLRFGGKDAKTYGWAAAFLVAAAAQFSFACWELTIASADEFNHVRSSVMTDHS